MDESELAEIFAANVRGLMESAGLTQAQLGERMGTAAPLVSRMLSAKHPPTARTLVRVAEALGVEPADLIAVPKKPRKKSG